MSEHHCKKIQATLDRFQEAHLWLHMMEENYHQCDRFRWYLNVFLKALDEVPALLKRELQNDSHWREWYKPHSQALKTDALIHFLGGRRNFVVHQAMLVPNSKASVGITELRGMKTGLGIQISPFEESDEAMSRYVERLARHGDFLGIFTEDEDSLPCIFREWYLKEFDEELVSLCAKAWLRIGENITATLRFLGEEVPPFDLSCGKHEARRYQYKLYDRAALCKDIPRDAQGDLQRMTQP